MIPRNESGGAAPFLLSCFLVFSLVSIFAPSYTLGPLGDFLVVDDSPTPADAVVVLLGGGPERVLKSAELHRLKLAPRIVFGSGYSRSEVLDRAPRGFVWETESHAYRTALVSLGVEPEDILIVASNKAFDTAHELETILSFARARDWDHLIIVSSSSHTRRVKLIFSRLGHGLTADIVSAPVPGFDRWWAQGETRRSLAYQYLSMVKEIWAQVRHYLTPADRLSTVAPNLTPTQ